MGTTLTGTTPQDTYDSLIKVTDNGPLSGTAKYLSDGLGNDSALALSTSQVGIGTTTPTYSLQVKGSGDTTIGIEGGASGLSSLNLGNTANLADGGIRYDNNTDTLILRANNAERLRITSAGNVGIGTSSPARALHVKSGTGTAQIESTTSTSTLYLGDSTSSAIDNQGVGSVGNDITITAGGNEKLRILSGGGITFNGDTAAANALDDYEEGTWTMGVSFGGASTGIAYLNNTGTYTKIGRQVTVNGVLTLTSKGSSTGVAGITGLPFTVGNTNSNYAAASLRFYNISFTNQFQAYGERNSTRIDLEEITVLGTVTRITDADFQNSSEIILSFTYFV
jgi:hypothetical protein